MKNNTDSRFEVEQVTITLPILLMAFLCFYFFFIRTHDNKYLLFTDSKDKIKYYITCNYNVIFVWIKNIRFWRFLYVINVILWLISSFYYELNIVFFYYLTYVSVIVSYYWCQPNITTIAFNIYTPLDIIYITTTVFLFHICDHMKSKLKI